ncbi:MAG TPA: BlaI/MecI/CopY family transcriptional regulator [Anaerovoracaceae bacterium]|nr:BlaI/MecI/CopY family transcriptional regulator [Anaerovoracaceae bacterium]
MEQLKLCESEYRFSEIVWENEPLGSGELVRLCEERLGWKKSATCTVLKKLCDRGVLRNEDAVITSIIKQEQVRLHESDQIVNRAFSDSLPQFISAFIGDNKLTKVQADKLIKLIASFKEE